MRGDHLRQAVAGVAFEQQTTLQRGLVQARAAVRRRAENGVFRLIATAVLTAPAKRPMAIEMDDVVAVRVDRGHQRIECRRRKGIDPHDAALAQIAEGRLDGISFRRCVQGQRIARASGDGQHLKTVGDWVRRRGLPKRDISRQLHASAGNKLLPFAVQQFPRQAGQINRVAIEAKLQTHGLTV